MAFLNLDFGRVKVVGLAARRRRMLAENQEPGSEFDGLSEAEIKVIIVGGVPKA